MVVLWMLFCFCGCASDDTRSEAPVARNGVLDLTRWDFSVDGSIALSGEYGFFWNRLVSPSDIIQSQETDLDGFILVPKSWNGYETQDGPVSGSGYATYYLHIKMPETARNLALKIFDFATAATVFVNGNEVYRVGVVGASPALTAPQFRPAVVTLGDLWTDIDLVVHISNYAHRKGGMWEKMMIGTADQLQKSRNTQISYDLVLFGSIFMIGLYHLGIYILRRNELSPLYFGLFCLLIALRLISTGERYLLEAIGSIPWELLIKLEYLSYYLAVPVFVQFIYSLFTERFSRQLCRIFIIIGLVFTASVVLSPARLFSHTLLIYQLFTVAIFVYAIVILISASIKMDKTALVFLAGFSILFLTALNDILHSNNVISTAYIVPAGLFVFIFSQAFLLSLHYANAFETIEKQQASLTQANITLENEVLERKQAEAEARASHERFLKVLDSIDADVYVADMQTFEILFMNQHMKDAFKKDFTGKICHEVFRGEKNACKHCTNSQLLNAKGQPEGVYTWECQNPLTGKWYINNDRAIFWDNNRIVRMQVATDVTVRKQAEDKLKRVNEELEKRVAERTTGILKANEALRLEVKERKRAEEAARTAKKTAEIANMAKSDFLANMSHELRTPLNHIIGFSELILDQHFGKLNDEQEEYLRDVYGSSKHLLSLINDILDLSKVESGKLELHRKQFSLKDLLNASTLMFKEKSLKHGIKLAVNLHDVPEMLNGDERKIKQVVYNLLSNAVKFTPDGGSVLLEAHACRLKDETRKGVKISVNDSGIGIESDDLVRIFTPFEQVEQSKSRRFQGTGLGLSLTKKLVELHGGDIWAESRGEDKGSSFHVVIPQ